MADKHKITVNAAICKVCNDRIESTHRHDYVTCSCGNLSVDGGYDYLKRTFQTPEGEGWEDASEWKEV